MHYTITRTPFTVPGNGERRRGWVLVAHPNGADAFALGYYGTRREAIAQAAVKLGGERA